MFLNPFLLFHDIIEAKMRFCFIVALEICGFINLFVRNNAQSNNGTSPKKYRIFVDFSLDSCKKYDILMYELLKGFELSATLESEIEESPFIASFHSDELDILNEEIPPKINLTLFMEQLNERLSYFISSSYDFGYFNNSIWQPIAWQNYGPQWKYIERQLISLNEKLYPVLKEEESREVALLRFEFASQNILSEVLKQLKQRVKKIQWGIFGYPKCDGPNFNPIYTNVECEDRVRQDNDNLFWLWDLNPVLYPSIAVFHRMDIQQVDNFFQAILEESKRISRKYSPPLKIVPYIHLKYIDKPDKFLSYNTFGTVMGALKKNEIDHFVIGCDSCSRFTEKDCNDFTLYLDTVFIELINTMLIVSEYREYGLAMLKMLKKIL